MRSLLVLLVLTSSAGACPPPQPTAPVPLMAGGATVMGDGGIVVRDGEGGGGTLQLRDAATGAALDGAWRPLAPGLSVFQPAAQRDRDIELVGDAGTVTVHQLRARGIPATPVIKAARASVRKPAAAASMTVAGSDLAIELRTALPAGAIALVVTDANKLGRLWLVPAKGQRTFVASIPTTKSCGVGMYPVYAGETITVAWVDANGRISPSSRPIEVRLARR